jgi:putative SOS response-associated peptidase YedK
LTHIRAESFSDKPSFLPFLRHHRCIVPASAFSVTSGREPYELTAADDAPLALGAIVNAAPAGEGRYELGAALLTLPRPASPQAASGRTPLVLPPSGVDAWLDVRPGAPDPESFLKASPEPLVRVPPRVSVFAAA